MTECSEAKEATCIGFADDLAVVVVAKHPEDVKLHASETIHAIKAWFQVMKLDLAENKTEAVLVTNRRKNKTVKIRVAYHEAVSKSIIR